MNLIILLLQCWIITLLMQTTVLAQQLISQERATELEHTLPPGRSLFYSTELKTLYHSGAALSLWRDSRAVAEFQQQLSEVALAGLAPQFSQWVQWLADPELDIECREQILSDALLGYLSFISLVQHDGRNILYGKLIKLTAPPQQEIKQWLAANQQGEMLKFIHSLAPQHPQYQQMRAALQNMLGQLDRRQWPEIVDTASLKVGQGSDYLRQLRAILLHDAELMGDSSISDLVQAGSHTGSGQIYSESLSEAVKRFQQWHGLEEDGVIGRRTRSWLNTSPRVRVSLLALNMQRLRLLPGQVKDGIMVNIPDYSLTYYRNSAVNLSSGVVVGTARRKTPLMDSSLVNVVINPPWNVPITLMREDIIPRVKRDPGYIYRLNYYIYSSWGEGAEQIDPSTIDWENISAKNFPYRLRQAPGENNALGRFKFNMPNSEAIYLHDSPNRGLFNRDVRAFSSGCVRVSKASELARLLLNEVGWDDNRIASTLQRGQTTTVPTKKKLVVELYYLTAWVAESGIVQYRTDIYDYDRTARSGLPIWQQVKTLLQ